MTKVNQLKVFLVGHNIGQKELHEQSGLGITSLHYMINEGRASNKTLRKVVTTLKESYGITISFEDLKEKMKTDSNG